ncbi:MAG TPA: TipAS antibiotic-recognition domain-containing protein [Mycobacteriales bacterium]|jgi:DNA-binding transcriptional MerR regulator|nr:TipAS antibiotic-recognition domain-containing protein [Mycobacteriales bacterium]
MAWSIAEVARMSKVTSRTLRHYDDVGLLTPAYVGSNGYRYYEQEQLLRLQQLLLLRELGLGLAAIAEVLNGQRDQVAALRRHEQWLHEERARLGRLAATVSRTIRQLHAGEQMNAPELFEGFADRQAQLETDLVAEHGEGVREHFRTARQVTRDWTQADYLDAKRRADELDDRVLAVLRSGAAPDSPAALDVMAEHYRSVAQFWTPDRTSYTGLGQLYVDDPEFKARYDAKAPGLAEYLRDATAAYAAQRLS